MRPHFLPNFSTKQVKHGLKHTLPYLENQGKVTLIADGFSSFVFLLNDDTILRVAKHSEAAAQQAKELRALPLLTPKLSLQIPQPSWYLEPSIHFPFGALAYPKIVGRPFDLSLHEQVDLEQVAFSLARFIYELHKLKIPAPKRDDEPAALWQAVNATLQTHLTKTQYRKAETWWGSFQSRSQKYSSLVHGDLWAENIILDEFLSKVVGIIDFELLATGDVAQDFAPQAYVSPEFAKMVSGGFKVLGGNLGDDFERRVQDWAVVRELRGLRYAISYPEAREFEDSLGKVVRVL